MRHETGALLAAFRRMLTPVVRTAIEAGLTFPRMIEALRELYVEVAARDFRLGGEAPTQSRLSLLTGVHRKELRRLAELPADLAPAPPQLTLAGRVLSHWLTDPDLLDAEGRPRPLPRSAVGEPSFDGLVAGVSTDLRPRTVLDELLRLGVVAQEGELIRLLTDAVGPDGDYADKAYYLGRNLRDHVATGTRNLSGELPTFLDRAAFHDGLTPDALEELRQLCAQRGRELLVEIHAHAALLARRDFGKAEARHRMTFGAYYHDDRPPETEPGP